MSTNNDRASLDAFRYERMHSEAGKAVQDHLGIHQAPPATQDALSDAKIIAPPSPNGFAEQDEPILDALRAIGAKPKLTRQGPVLWPSNDWLMNDRVYTVANPPPHIEQVKLPGARIALWHDLPGGDDSLGADVLIHRVGDDTVVKFVLDTMEHSEDNATLEVLTVCPWESFEEDSACWLSALALEYLSKVTDPLRAVARTLMASVAPHRIVEGVLTGLTRDLRGVEQGELLAEVVRSALALEPDLRESFRRFAQTADLDFCNESVPDGEGVVVRVQRIFEGMDHIVIGLECVEPAENRYLGFNEEPRLLYVEVDDQDQGRLKQPALRIEEQRIVLCDPKLQAATIVDVAQGTSSIEVVLRRPYDPDWWRL